MEILTNYFIETTNMKRTVLSSSADLGKLGARFATPKKSTTAQQV